MSGQDEFDNWRQGGQSSLAHPVNVAESSSPMPGLSPKQERADYLIRQDRLVSLALEAMSRIEQSQSRQESILLKIIEALAEDQDPDEMPATYMDGKLV